MKIAVDAMGGDRAPGVVIEGVAEALDSMRDAEIILVGNLEKITPLLKDCGIYNHPRLKLVHAEQSISMGEPSTVAIRSKKNSSITVAASLVRDGQAEAVVSAGHTGAAVAATVFKMKMLSGIERPGIATVMPSPKGSFILIDAGANIDSKPLHLAQFAVMGEIYAKFYLGINRPRIGLLSVGEEDVKGNELTKETFKKLSEMPVNFIGNVEGKVLYDKFADVVVCDGFVGNLVLKSSESLAKAIMYWLREAFTKNTVRKTGAILAKEAFKELKAIGDYEEYGGAPLLGVNGVCIIGHGSSSPKAIKNAIRTAREFLKFKINDHIKNRIAEAGIASTTNKHDLEHEQH